MTIANAITNAQNKVAAAYTAVSAKGGTLPATQNLTNLATAIGTISGGGSSKKYSLLQRVKDDTNTEIGTVAGFETDTNNIEYAVVVLDASYRETGETSSKTCSANPSGASGFSEGRNFFTLFSNKDTAKSACDKAVAAMTTISGTSPLVTYCRSFSFTIDGVVYTAQAPTMLIALMCAEHATELTNLDPTVSSHPDERLGDSRIRTVSLVDSTATSPYSWSVDSDTATSTTSRFLSYTAGGTAVPVLEIPNA